MRGLRRLHNWLRSARSSLDGGSNADSADLTLLGFPFRATGRGEHLRAVFRAMTAVGLNPRVYDLGGLRREVDGSRALRSSLVGKLSRGGIRIFHCNGDEAAPAIAHLEEGKEGLFSAGYNIIYPAWELPNYPKKWAVELDRFDEIWAATKFVHDSLEPRVSVPLLHVRNACQPEIEARLERGHFGLRARDYVVLVLFDHSSYAERKNPMAAIEAFRAAQAARPNARLRLVVKSHHSRGKVAARIRGAVSGLGDAGVLIDRTMSDNEVKNLIAASDCFLSLHRSEGFGRGPAEAMFLGKPAIATGWSGNMDYMTPEVSFPVGYRLVPVGPEEYIEADGQFWADPDVEAATEMLLRLVDNPSLGPEIGGKAALHMQRHYSDAVLGETYRARLREIDARRNRASAVSSSQPR